MKQTLREKLQSDLRDMIARKQQLDEWIEEALKEENYLIAAERKIKSDIFGIVIERIQYTLSNY